jgi:hypothetical protein
VNDQQLKEAIRRERESAQLRSRGDAWCLYAFTILVMAIAYGCNH